MITISIVVPTYNEEENVVPLTKAIMEEFQTNLPNYRMELLFIDNDSQDNTRTLIRGLCAEYPEVRAIFNLKNFGPDNSPYYGLTQATGDCAILFCADFQDPVEMIHKLVEEWENGYTVVTAIKTTSKENPVVRFFRTCYYKMIRKLSDTEIIEHFTGFGLYDRSFLDIMRSLNDSTPFLRGVVAEYSSNRKEIPYQQQKRRAGKSHIHFFTLYDMAMRSVTSYTKIALRISTLVGFCMAGVSIVIALYYFIRKLLNWYAFDMGSAPILIGMFTLSAVQLIFLGLIGEYIMSINMRTMHRPLVIEKERLNFDEKEKRDKVDE